MQCVGSVQCGEQITEMYFIDRKDDIGLGFLLPPQKVIVQVVSLLATVTGATSISRLECFHLNITGTA